MMSSQTMNALDVVRPQSPRIRRGMNALDVDPNYDSEEDEDYVPDDEDEKKTSGTKALKRKRTAEEAKPVSVKNSRGEVVEEEDDQDAKHIEESLKRKQKVDSLWEELNAGASKQPSPLGGGFSAAKSLSSVLNGRVSSRKRSQPLEFSCPKLSVDLTVSRMPQAQITTVTEKVKYAGQEYSVTRQIKSTAETCTTMQAGADASDIRARLKLAAKAAMAAKASGTKKTSAALSASESTSASVNKLSALDKMVEKATAKTKKVTTVEKSDIDWDRFKKEEKIEDELNQYTKDGYLAKQDFLHRVDHRQFEKEKEDREQQRRKLAAQEKAKKPIT